MSVLEIFHSMRKNEKTGLGSMFARRLWSDAINFAASLSLKYKIGLAKRAPQIYNIQFFTLAAKQVEAIAVKMAEDRIMPEKRMWP